MRDKRVVLTRASVLLLRWVWNSLPLGAARTAGSSGWRLLRRLARWCSFEVVERGGAGKGECDMPEPPQLRRVFDAPESSCRRRVVRCLAGVPRRHVPVCGAVGGACWRYAVCLKVKSGGTICCHVVCL